MSDDLGGPQQSVQVSPELVESDMRAWSRHIQPVENVPNLD